MLYLQTVQLKTSAVKKTVAHLRRPGAMGLLASTFVPAVISHSQRAASDFLVTRRPISGRAHRHNAQVRLNLTEDFSGNINYDRP